MTISRVVVWRAGEAAPEETPLLLEVGSEEGLGAWAELLPEAEAGEMAEVAADLGSLVVGHDAWERGALWQRLAEEINWAESPDPAAAAVVSALDLALQQLAALQAGVPLYRLLGGAYFARLDTVVEAPGAAEGKQPPAGGLVLGPAPDAAGAVRRAEELRRRHGDQLRMCVDLGEGCAEVEEARGLLQRLQNVEAFWCADPLPHEQVGELRELSRAIELPLAGGSRATGLKACLRLLWDARVDLLALDPRRCGGLTGAARIATVAAAHHVPVVLRPGPGTLTRLPALHLAITSGWYQAPPRPVEVPAEALTEQAGFVELSAAPGLGYDPGPELRERYSPVAPE